MSEQLLEKIKNHTANIAILGMGYVGLPLAVVFAEAGYRVTGIDPDERKVETINQKRSHIQDVPDTKIDQLVSAGLLHATTDFSILAGADAVSICVPTPLRKTGDPDLTYILNATDEMTKFMHRDMIIVLESTTYPGTTREILLPKLGAQNGLKVGEDFYLAFSPERVDPGRTDWTTYNTPKVIGGITQACSEMAAAWYAEALETVVPVSSAEVAEMTKLLENTFRMINIGLVNEMAIMCDRLGVDIWEVIEAADTKPFGFMKFTPGPGLGGHCIPIDPLYLSWKLRGLNYTARFIELASEINTQMPRYVVNKIQNALNETGKPLKGSRILILGVAYKPDVDDLRESPALDVIQLLKEKGSSVSYHDPLIPTLDLDDTRLSSTTDLYAAISNSDCVVTITNHSSYDYPAIIQSVLASTKETLIVDTRNAFGSIAKGNPRVFKL